MPGSAREFIPCRRKETDQDRVLSMPETGP